MKLYFLLLSLFFSVNLNAQHDIIMEAAPLSYKQEIPDTNTYRIIVNNTGSPVSEQFLLKLNLQRRNEDIIWTPAEGLVILVIGMDNLKKK